MGFKDLIKNVGDNLSKSIQSKKINDEMIKKAVNIKKKVLINLSLTELKEVAYLLGMGNLEVVEDYDLEKGFVKKRIKLDKSDYIEKIANKPADEVCLKLRYIKKTNLADEIEREVDFIKKDADKKIKALYQKNNKEETEQEDMIFSNILEGIINEIISVRPEIHKNEKGYQTELLGTLKGALPKIFKKQKISLVTEYKLKTNKRLDILIQVDSYKIAIETKYNLSPSGSFQRAVGQILEYSNFVDAVILVQYESLDNETGLENIKELKNLIKKPLKVIANGVILT
ncbi:hypothetical protein GYA25_00260 [Candidatus Woesearchaeota archaeon]|nr:hypothetical protein [Candidatus Woesearchaeota archaeon]